MQTFVWNNLNTVEKQQALTRPAISASNEIKSAVENDVILIAGKGHEDYQIIGKTKHHFSDQEVARHYLSH